MATVCLQCALEEMVRSGDPAKMREAAMFEESPEEHMRRVHPDPAATKRRRAELERLMVLQWFDPADDETKH